QPGRRVRAVAARGAAFAAGDQGAAARARAGQAAAGRVGSAQARLLGAAAGKLQRGLARALRARGRARAAGRSLLARHGGPNPVEKSARGAGLAPPRLHVHRAAALARANAPAMTSRILVVRRDNIGDLVCATPLLAALRRQFPGAHIAALVNSYNAAVLAGNP